MMKHLMNKETTLETIVLQLQAEFDEELFSYLVKRVQPLVFSTIKKYRQPYIDKDDLYQEAIIALYKAVEKYDIQFKAYFIGYYRMVMKHHIQRNIKRHLAAKRGSGESWKDISLEADLSKNKDSTLNVADTLKSDTISGEDYSLAREIFDDYISRLDEEEEQFVYLKVTGHSLPEIAEKINLSLAQTRYLSRKCRIKFDKAVFNSSLYKK
ncbi:sigma-70 family RNA polymerase sigma factor [Aerococcaceae bacterium DSM 111020]|nr:sigma-70 family RNA polymerase sigma factor [Aerococcaceae bacterium DSM 111020]